MTRRIISPAPLHGEGGGQPRPGPARQHGRDRGQRPGQHRRPARETRGQALGLLGEGDLRAGRVQAPEPARRQPDHHRPAAAGTSRSRRG